MREPRARILGHRLRTICVPCKGQIGQELASQAISTAGELRRIERDRVESLADLEQEYSDRILAINEEKRRRLAEVEQAIETERVRRLASIQQAFDAAKEAEIYGSTGERQTESSR